MVLYRFEQILEGLKSKGQENGIEARLIPLVDESAEHKNNTYIIELYASFKDHLEQGAFAQLKIMEEGDKVKIYRPKSNRKSIRIFDFLKEIELIEKIEEWQDQVCSPEKIFEDEKTMISYRYAK